MIMKKYLLLFCEEQRDCVIITYSNNIIFLNLMNMQIAFVLKGHINNYCHIYLIRNLNYSINGIFYISSEK